ncbi:MAG: hypothetical protein AAGF12_20320 [Myxococcota bacterium]
MGWALLLLLSVSGCGGAAVRDSSAAGGGASATGASASSEGASDDADADAVWHADAVWDGVAGWFRPRQREGWVILRGLGPERSGSGVSVELALTRRVEALSPRSEDRFVTEGVRVVLLLSRSGSGFSVAEVSESRLSASELDAIYSAMEEEEAAFR